MGDAILIRNRLIPGAEWIRYESLARYADRIGKELPLNWKVPLNLEVYVNKDRQEFLVRETVAHLSLIEWTIVRFEKKNEFEEFMNRLLECQGNMGEFSKLLSLLVSEENPPYAIRRTTPGEDYEIRAER